MVQSATGDGDLSDYFSYSMVAQSVPIKTMEKAAAAAIDAYRESSAHSPVQYPGLAASLTAEGQAIGAMSRQLNVPLDNFSGGVNQDFLGVYPFVRP